MLEELSRIQKEYGDIEVTCTGSTLPDQEPNQTCGIPLVFETTADNLIVNSKHPRHGSAVRIYM